jgi:uncharacterized membrane protein YkvA (DUF1232 family)
MAGIPKGFGPYLTRANRILRSPRLVSTLVYQAGSRLAAEGSVSAALESVRSDLRTSLALVRAWVSGRYAGVSTQGVVLVVAGLAYLVTPVDAIPDVLPGVGLLDDLTVLGFVFGQLQQELAQFQDWQAASSKDLSSL